MLMIFKKNLRKKDRSALEQQVHALETEVKLLMARMNKESQSRIELEKELSGYKEMEEYEYQARIELEKELKKINEICTLYREKYELECLAHADEVKDIRRRMDQKATELEQYKEALHIKCSDLEEAKSSLLNGMEVLVTDLEKATIHVAVYQKLNMELKSRVEEITALYKTSQRDLQTAYQEIDMVGAQLGKKKLTVKNPRIGASYHFKEELIRTANQKDEEKDDLDKSYVKKELSKLKKLALKNLKKDRAKKIK